MFDFSSKSSMLGRSVLITGANGFLGSKISVLMAELGAYVLLLDHPDSNFNKTLDLLGKIPDAKYQAIDCDLSDETSRNKVIDSLCGSLQSLHCLINNAAFVGSSALSGWSVEFARQSLSSWRSALEVNLTAPFHLSQGFAELMRKSEGSNIINISSIYGSLGPDWSLYEGTQMANPAAYSVSKGGLMQLTRWLATTLSPDIRVNSISPGGIYRSQDDLFVDRYSSRCPLNRMATEDDLLGAVLFLATDLSGYVTGENIDVDGGWSKW